jgi:hypothetical protein
MGKEASLLIQLCEYEILMNKITATVKFGFEGNEG